MPTNNYVLTLNFSKKPATNLLNLKLGLMLSLIAASYTSNFNLIALNDFGDNSCKIGFAFSIAR
jgi:hypothetical protein